MFREGAFFSITLLFSYPWGQDYKEKHKTRLKTNVKRTVLNNTKLRHFWAQIVSWAPIHARKTFIILAPGSCFDTIFSDIFQQNWIIGMTFSVLSLSNSILARYTGIFLKTFWTWNVVKFFVHARKCFIIKTKLKPMHVSTSIIIILASMCVQPSTAYELAVLMLQTYSIIMYLAECHKIQGRCPLFRWKWNMGGNNYFNLYHPYFFMGA